MYKKLRYAGKIFVIFTSIVSSDPSFGHQHAPTPKKISKVNIFRFTHVKVHPDIFGGVTAPDKEFPFIAALGQVADPFSFDGNCGGILVADEWVLTAAHCADKADWVVLGRQDLTGGDGEVHRVIDRDHNVLCHRKFDRETLENDLALIKIQRTPQQIREIRPVRIASNDSWEDRPPPVILAGWGDNPNSPQLQVALVSYLKRDQCKKYHWGPIIINNDSICTFSKTGGALRGDSGGPAMIRNDGVYSLVGIISAGKMKGFPNKHSRTTSFLGNWIAPVITGARDNTALCSARKHLR